ncbi:DMT family transporter [Salinibacterium sp. ZJ70]|uniref:DMT family transporter n=1 Tax=Salinibacterium sp. ZJ70 TaxID=2708084 RepID=UPI001CD6070C|nr:DMT family transporter [Salinibacterium sp. ZJ70]
MSQDHAQRPLLRAVATIAALIVGAFMAVQPRVNGQLGVELGDGVLAAFYSFASGMLVCGIALVLWAPGRRGLASLREAIADRRMTPWFLIGGCFGALMVLSQGLTAAVLGVAVFTVALVGGQAIGSLLVDRRGLGTMAPTALTPPRVAGAALAVVAVGWAVSDRLGGGIPWWMLVLPFVAGIGTSWQAAANAQLRFHARSVLSATFVSFTAGTAVLAIAAAVDLALAGPPQTLPAEPWLYTGGLLGIVFVAGGAAIVPITGVLVYGLATIAGQLTAAVLLDLFVPVAGAGLSLSTIGGALLAVIAVGIASMGRRPGRLA